jgi:two-component system invasion response regulator UvrY
VIRVLVVDDHAIVREGLKQILASRSDMKVTGEAATRDEVLTMTRAEHFDVVILDITLGQHSGIELLSHLRHEHSALPVLILSMHPEEQYAARLLRAGAAGYLSKESAPDRLVEAILKVAAGGRYVSAAMAERLAFDVSSGSADREPHDRLSDREFQIFQLIANGARPTEIAENLNLSVKTVSTHRTRILTKMGFRSNAQIIHYAVRHGLVG